MIRAARSDELERLQEIERAAGAIFADLGMHAIADDDPPSVWMLAGYRRAGRAWVFAAEHEEPVAYLLIDVVDERGHIEQLSVHPRAARRGLGALLIDAAAGWAHDHALTALTLTTFRDVPWNRPYYERLGFEVVDDEDVTDGLRRLRTEEIAAGLDRWPRVVMQRRVGPRSG